MMVWGSMGECGMPRAFSPSEGSMWYKSKWMNLGCLLEHSPEVVQLAIFG